MKALLLFKLSDVSFEKKMNIIKIRREKIWSLIKYPGYYP